MKSQKQAKILFGFGLSMMDKAIENINNYLNPKQFRIFLK